MKNTNNNNINAANNTTSINDEDKSAHMDSVIKEQYKNINGLVVVHKNHIIVEKYYNGYNEKDSFHVASATKSVLSALIGIAIDKKYIKSIDEKVIDFFPEYDFANEYLFFPLGMNCIPKNKIDKFNFHTLFGSKLKDWAYDTKGNSTGGWGLTLTIRDMARFGSLYMNDGVWNNKVIISKEWIKKS